MIFFKKNPKIIFLSCEMKLVNSLKVIHKELNIFFYNFLFDNSH